MLSEEILLSVARWTNPQVFKDPFLIWAGEGQKIIGVHRMEIVHLKPVKKHCDAFFKVDVYGKELRRANGDLSESKPEDLKRSTEPISIVKRDKLRIDYFTIAQGMKNVFKADILLLDEYTGHPYEKENLKYRLQQEGVSLIYTNELLAVANKAG